MLTLITDRTQSDVNRAKEIIEKAKNIENLSSSELEEYLGGLKGCYNISDLNRVEESVKYISDLLNSLSYYNVVDVKTWVDGEFMNSSQLKRYLNNLNILKNAYVVYSTTPVTPPSYKPYNYANDIEKILINIEEIIGNMEKYFIRCGASNCGQNRIWQQRFRRVSTWISFNYSLDKYNQAWNTIAVPSEETGTFPTDNREKISMTLNLWNNKLIDLDGLVGVIS